MTTEHIKNTLSRRQFLRNTLIGSVGMSLAASPLGAIRLAMAQNQPAPSDYKALVCVFLYGGNDSLNMLVPTDESAYQEYQSVRQNLAFPQSALLPLSTTASLPYSLGMPEAMAPLHDLFQNQALSIVSNVGPLLRPVSKSQLQGNIDLAPPQLFSHNDQQKHWQSAMPDQIARSGWAGRMADILQPAGAALPMNLSLDGIQLAQTGADTIPYSLTSGGPEVAIPLDGTKSWNQTRREAFNRIMSAAQHPMEQGYARLLERAEQHNQLVSQALESTSPVQTAFPSDNALADQLQMVSRLIQSHQALGQQRQVYFVGMGGWDTHDQQVSRHPQLLNSLSQALASFYQELSLTGFADTVTTFTLSDFGRTLTSNGDGTDHGWGGHQLVLGGAVNGGKVIGRLPALHLNSDDDLGGGRMIPTLASDQYFASIARWFGIDEDNLSGILPNLHRFDGLPTPLFT